MNLFGSLLHNTDVLSEYPTLIKKYEMIASNNPNIDNEDMEGFLKDERFLKKYKLYSSDIVESLSLTFNIIKKEKQKMDDLIFKMREIEKKLQFKIYKFAAKKSIAINKLYPNILDLDSDSSYISTIINKLKKNIVKRRRKIGLLNEKIERNIIIKRNLIIYLELLKKKMINNFFIPVQETEDKSYLNSLTNSIDKLRENEYLLSSNIYHYKKHIINQRIFFYWSDISFKFNRKKYLNLIAFLKENNEKNIFGSLSKGVSQFYSFFIRMIVVKNIRGSVFNEVFHTKVTTQLYLLNDFYKLEVLLPTMEATNLCKFLVDLLLDFKFFFQAIELQIFRLYQMQDFKDDNFITELKKAYLVNKIGISKYMTEMFTSILDAINIQELGELKIGSFIRFLLKYEDFCFYLSKFTCHFPDIPNKHIINIVNEYFKSLKENSLRLIFHEVMSENWNNFYFNAQLFEEKITRYRTKNTQCLKTTKKLQSDINAMKESIKKRVLTATVRNNDFFNNEESNTNIVYPDSTAEVRDRKPDRIIYRTVVTFNTIYSNYAKISGLFGEYKHLIAEDCSFMLNIWIFSEIVKFIPESWVNLLINFEKRVYAEDYGNLQNVEQLHDFFVFKYNYRELRRSLYNFNYQFYNNKESHKIYFKSLIQNIKYETESKTLKNLIVLLKSFDHVFKIFNFFDEEDQYDYNKSLLQNIERFMLSYFFLENYKHHPVFEKVLNFNWSTLDVLVPVDRNPYLNQFKGIILEFQAAFLELKDQGLELSKSEITEYMFILVDMIFTVLIEIYSQVRNCSITGRMQMKNDIGEILKGLVDIITKNMIDELNNKFSGYVVSYFENDSKGHYKFIMKNFNTFSFNMTKSLLITNKKSDLKTQKKKNKIVMSEDQIKLLNYAARKVYKRIKEECADEDFLEENILKDAIKTDENPSDDKLNILLNFVNTTSISSVYR